MQPGIDLGGLLQVWSHSAGRLMDYLNLERSIQEALQMCTPQATPGCCGRGVAVDASPTAVSSRPKHSPSTVRSQRNLGALVQLVFASGLL